MTEENVHAAKDAGAQFALAPALNPEVVAEAQQADLPFLPGVATPSEIERGLSLGCQVLKFYPVAALGAAATIKTLAGPYRHTGVRFLPTGGVHVESLAEYLGIDEVVAVGGSWLAKPSDVASGDWSGITARCRDAARRVKEARGG